MRNKLFNAIKVSLLACLLSFGLSFVYAWTAPTSQPPAGNVSAPINTSATLQQKSGDFTVGNFMANTVTVSGTPVLNAITAPKFCISASCITAWPAVGGSGTVTSLSAGTGITLSPNPIITTGTISVDTAVVQSRVSGTCAVGQAITAIAANGTMTCGVASGGTGLKGIFYPLRGKTTSVCSFATAMYGLVSADGTPYIVDNGVQYQAVTRTSVQGCAHIQLHLTTSGLQVASDMAGNCSAQPATQDICYAPFPLN